MPPSHRRTSSGTVDTDGAACNLDSVRIAVSRLSAATLRFMPFVRRSRVGLAAITLLLLCSTGAKAGLGDCGQPLSNGTTPTASDALFALRAAVGTETCALQTCDADGNCSVAATDALLILKAAVGQAVSVTCDCNTGSNQAPEITTTEIYRAYVGYPISWTIEAEDPDGDDLSYSAIGLPDGCTMDSSSGEITWLPTAEQIGATYIPVTVTDSGTPPLTANAIVTFRVSPVDTCSAIDCDPTAGCHAASIPIESDCCLAEPEERVAEPIAGCPQGRVAYIGRNNVGFGRLQNCDLMETIFFPQGGSNVRFHVESRCLNIEERITITAKMETADGVLFDVTREITMQQRDDGFQQRLGLFYGISPDFEPSDLDGSEAELSVTLTDTDGESASTTVRLVLTLDPPPDLPNPDPDDVPAGEVGCVGCHRPIGTNGLRHGIEDPHPWESLTCTECHGGNPDANTRAAAHVSPGDGPSFIRNLAPDEIDNIGRDYIQFINPGDLRVADRTCGTAGCHPEHVANVPLSTMSTYGGHYTLPRYLAGGQGREGIVGAADVVDPDFDAATAPEGAVEMLSALREPDPAADRSEIATVIDTYLPKSCPTCHLNGFGKNQADGTYRSSGCTACHMVYSDEGLSESDDPMIDKNFPPHPVKHVLTSAIPVEQCTHCHFQGGRIGLHYRGIREGGFGPEKTPPNAEPIGRPLYGHESDFYFTDEDSTTFEDETPPDLHFEAGMSCVDCHVGGDVHGDGNLYTAERYQVGIRCEDCHGSVRETIQETDGFFRNSKGDPLKRLRRTLAGQIKLKLANEDTELTVQQIKETLDRGFNPFMNEAMGVDEDGFSHTDSLECYTCHTSWRQNCFGCHVTVNDSLNARNEMTGQSSQGAVSAWREDYSIDFYALGMNRRGKLSPLCSSMSMFMSYVDENGTLQYQDKVRTSSDGQIGFGWNPFHHHTVSRIPQNCDTCHPNAASVGEDNSATLLETYGFGSGEILVADDEGTVHDLTRFLDDDGNLISDFPHPGTGPVPGDVRQRALSTEVVPQPR